MILEVIKVVHKSQGKRDRPIIQVKCAYCSRRYNIKRWPGEITAQRCISCRNKMNGAKRRNAMKRLGIPGMRCE